LAACLTAGLFLSSCSTVRPVPGTSIGYPPASARRRTVHTVAPGETLWRISQMYNVPIATITRANRISDRTPIKYGQKLVIPNASALRPVISLYPNDQWRYIIIHHSGTDQGSSLNFHEYHLHKGWDRGVGYHFVIDNGRGDKQDGQIEVTPRWLKQQDGAHCKAGGMNPQAIGICLVGNFNHSRVSAAQMDSLVYLLNKLRQYYGIPKRRIMGHRDVTGSHTDCPGKKFPWTALRRRLR